MRHVSITAAVPRADADTVFARIADFARYPEHTEAVREVVITERDGTVLTSAWSVNFRNGVLRWTERNRFDQHNRVIEFTQLDGDFARFDGCWRVVQKPEAVDVEFTAVFDLGMASLAAILDPIAATPGT
jgi:ribosome-associated toxin RatA of RatAB toxin-antitoxin module